MTHNHFGVTFGTLPDETLDISDSMGKSFRVRVADVKRIAIDRGTLLLRLPATIDLTALPFADQAAINHLTAGAWLTVNYWDNLNQRFATKDFQFIQMANGMAILADPKQTINPGDSGGGVSFAERLIGNTWSSMPTSVEIRSAVQRGAGAAAGRSHAVEARLAGFRPHVVRVEFDIKATVVLREKSRSALCP